MQDSLVLLQPSLAFLTDDGTHLTAIYLWQYMQDYFQLLQPGLQLLRPPKKDYEGPLQGGMVPYTSQVFQQEWGILPSQVS